MAKASLKPKSDPTDIIKALVGYVLFALSGIGFLMLMLLSPLLFTSKLTVSRAQVIAMFLVAFVVLVAIFILSRFLLKNNRLRPRNVFTDSLSDIFTSPPVWLVDSNNSARQYEMMVLDASKRTMQFKNDKNHATITFQFSDLELIRQSRNLRLPAFYMKSKKGVRYTVAFVKELQDIAGLNKSLKTAVLAGDAVALLSYKSSEKSSTYGQYGNDILESLHIWLRKNNVVQYKNKLSRNVVMLVVFISAFPIIMTFGIVIESFFN